MIQIGVQTGGIEEAHGIDGAYRLIHEAGFDAADANIDHLYSYQAIMGHQKMPVFDASDKDCVEYFRPWKEAAEKYGIDNYQAHAPFPSYIRDESGEQNDYMIQALKKCIIGCDYMNCRRLITIPSSWDTTNRWIRKLEWDVNIERYSRLIPEAKKYGVIVCLENMFTGYRGKIYSACCSDIDSACRYIDTLNEIAGQKCFGFCLDTGHLLLLGKDIKNTMMQLGDRIEAFHVHDNDGKMTSTSHPIWAFWTGTALSRVCMPSATIKRSASKPITYGTSSTGNCAPISCVLSPGRAACLPAAWRKATDLSEYVPPPGSLPGFL